MEGRGCGHLPEPDRVGRSLGAPAPGLLLVNTRVPRPLLTLKISGSGGRSPGTPAWRDAPLQTSAAPGVGGWVSPCGGGG